MFALYDKLTGAIKQLQSCPDNPDEFLDVLDVSDDLQLISMRELGREFLVVNGSLQAKSPEPEPTKEEVDAEGREKIVQTKLSGIYQVNSLIGQKRSEYITDIPGQEMTYLGKEREAREYVSVYTSPLLLPNSINYPFIAADAQAFQVTAYEAAQTILNKANQWRQIGAYLESLRLTANEKIRILVEEAAIESVVTQLKETLYA